LTKNSPLKASSPHISIIGHITDTELRQRITRTELANGFGNRFLFFCVRRARLLPFGGDLDDAQVLQLAQRVKAAFEAARHIGRVKMSADARDMWAAVYEPLSAEQSGLLGAITARAEAQTIRLSLLYALMDGSDEIGPAHLQAALAVWTCAE